MFCCCITVNKRRCAAFGRPVLSTCSTPAEVWPKLTRQSVPSPPSDYARRLDRAVDVALTCCACVSAPKGANRGADKSALDATRSRAGMRCVGPCRAALAHPRARATVGCAQRLRLHPPLPLAAGTLARRRLVSILHPGRVCAAGSSRSSTRVESGLGVGSCPRLALRAAWSPSSSPSCALRADRARAAGATPHASQFCSREPPPPPLACPPRGAPLGLARPRPRRARLPTPAPRPRQIGSRGRRPCAAGSSPGGTWHEHRPPVRPTLIFGPSTHRWPPRMGLELSLIHI